MAGWNGSGSFTRVHDWTDDRDGGTKILASRLDAEDDNFATGIQACLAKNGENAATANLPMGGFRHTGVGNSSSRTHYGVTGQIQDGAYNYAVAGGTADAITMSLSPSITAYAEGVIYAGRPSANNTSTTPTLNIDGIGAKTIVKRGSSALAPNDIVGDELALFTYNATDDNINLLNPAVDNGITASSTDTLTNKTIDADNNTVSNIAIGAECTGASTDLTDTADITYNADTDVSANGWVVDEDDFSSNLDTKVPTQQSTKAYVDGAVGLTLGTEQATTSGTSKTFSGIPAGTSMIVISFDQVSLSGTDNLLVQIGDSGGLETTGYVSAARYGGAGVSSTSGFIVRLATAGAHISGQMILTHMTGNKWSAAVSGGYSAASDAHTGGGVKTLSGELTQLAVLATGSNTLDAGAVNIAYF